MTTPPAVILSEAKNLKGRAKPKQRSFDFAQDDNNPPAVILSEAKNLNGTNNKQ